MGGYRYIHFNEARTLVGIDWDVGIESNESIMVDAVLGCWMIQPTRIRRPMNLRVDGLV